MSSFVYLLVWSPPPHIPYISSPNHCLLFAAHAHTIATCFAVVSILYHLFLFSLTSLLGTLSFTLTLHIHLTILISARWSPTSSSFPESCDNRAVDVAAGKKKEGRDQKPPECHQRQEAIGQHASVHKRNQNAAIAVTSVATVTSVNISRSWILRCDSYTVSQLNWEEELFRCTCFDCVCCYIKTISFLADGLTVYPSL